MPSSVSIDRYNIAAKVPAGATDEHLKLMFQNLLVERLGLLVHGEAREMPIYDLVVAKGGAKIKAVERPQTSSAPPIAVSALPKDKQGWPILPPEAVGAWGYTVRPYSRRMYRAQPISELADTLQILLGRPVVDKTGLIGVYSFDLTITQPDQPLSRDPSEVRDRASAINANMLAALESQLGLRAVTGKGQVEVLVVDRVNAKPSEN